MTRAALACTIAFALLSPTVTQAETPPIFVAEWGDSGTATGQFDTPYSVAVDPSGNVYVVDGLNQRIQKFGNDGLFVTTWGDSGSTDGQFQFPIRLDVDDSGFVYVCDLQAYRIQKFNSDGAFVRTWGTTGDGSGEFLAPFGVAVDNNARVFVADYYRIQKFDTTGIYLSEWGSLGSGPGQLDIAYDVALSPFGSVYVAESNNHRVQRFTTNGTYLGEWPVIGIYSVGTDSHGNVYVTRADTLTAEAQIVKYDSVGVVLTSWGSTGTGPGEFVIAFDVAIDANDNVFVADTGNHRIQKFSYIPIPDLTVSVAAPASATSCDDITVTATVSNEGNKTAGPFDVSLRVSLFPFITGTDSLLATVAFDSLPAGVDSMVAFVGPYTGPPGNVYLGVIVDDGDAVTELFEDNNTDTTPFQYGPPQVNSVIDVPDDQGGFVFLSWFASAFDAVSAGGLITEYTLWRAIDTSPSLVAGEWTDVDGATPVPRKTGSVMRMSAAADPYFWELVASQGGFHLPQYAKTLPTLFDSVSVNSGFHYFMVIAHTSDPLVFYVSCVDSAKSIDNLAPAQPQNLVALQSGVEELTLSWDANGEVDLLQYAVYRGTDPGFTPDTGNRIGQPTSPEFLDGEWSWDSGYYYKVTAIDDHGNESPAASAGGTVTGVPQTAPLSTYLGTNHPNPFNPATTIRFGLERDGFVTLTIYDVAGHVVRRLVEDRRAAQNYSVRWDGTTDRGAQVASGIYFYRLEAGSFSQTRKMVLLK